MGRHRYLRVFKKPARRNSQTPGQLLRHPQRGGQTLSRPGYLGHSPLYFLGRRRAGSIRLDWQLHAAGSPQKPIFSRKKHPDHPKPAADNRLAPSPDFRPFLLHVHQMVRRRRRSQVLQPALIPIRSLYLFYERFTGSQIENTAWLDISTWATATYSSVWTPTVWSATSTSRTSA